MKTLEVRTAQVPELKETLSYALLEDRGRYGVSVQKAGASELVADVTSQRETAQILFDRIVRGTVTPVSLKEITEDFVNDL